MLILNSNDNPPECCPDFTVPNFKMWKSNGKILNTWMKTPKQWIKTQLSYLGAQEVAPELVGFVLIGLWTSPLVRQKHKAKLQQI